MKRIGIVRALLVELLGLLVLLWVLLPTQRQTHSPTTAPLPRLHIATSAEPRHAQANEQSSDIQQQRLQQQRRRHAFVARELDDSSRLLTAAFRYHLKTLWNARPGTKRD